MCCKNLISLIDIWTSQKSAGMSTSEKTEKSKKGKEKGEGNGGKKSKGSSGVGNSGKNNPDGVSTKKGEKYNYRYSF